MYISLKCSSASSFQVVVCHRDSLFSQHTIPFRVPQKWASVMTVMYAIVWPILSYASFSLSFSFLLSFYTSLFPEGSSWFQGNRVSHIISNPSIFPVHFSTSLCLVLINTGQYKGKVVDREYEVSIHLHMETHRNKNASIFHPFSYVLSSFSLSLYFFSMPHALCCPLNWIIMLTGRGRTSVL